MFFQNISTELSKRLCKTFVFLRWRGCQVKVKNLTISEKYQKDKLQSFFPLRFISFLSPLTEKYDFVKHRMLMGLNFQQKMAPLRILPISFAQDRLAASALLPDGDAPHGKHRIPAQRMEAVLPSTHTVTVPAGPQGAPPCHPLLCAGTKQDAAPVKRIWQHKWVRQMRISLFSLSYTWRCSPQSRWNDWPRRVVFIRARVWFSSFPEILPHLVHWHQGLVGLSWPCWNTKPQSTELTSGSAFLSTWNPCMALGMPALGHCRNGLRGYGTAAAVHTSDSLWGTKAKRLP